MRTPSCVRRVAGVAAFTIVSTFGAFALCLLGTGQALAIPSPELVVGSFVSLSQLFALGSAILGGGAAYATMRARRRGGAPEMPRGLMYTAVGLFAVLAVSIVINIWQYVAQTNERQARLESTLLRPSRAPAGLPDDPDAKEINFSQQAPAADQHGGNRKAARGPQSWRSRSVRFPGCPRKRGAGDGLAEGRDHCALP